MSRDKNLQEFKLTSEEKNLFADFDIQKYLEKAPPSDNSFTTIQELKELTRIPINERFVEENDDLQQVFTNLLTDIKDHKLLKLLINGSRPSILEIKDYHARPRPRELAKKFNIKLNSKEMESMDTPSYPSGHSAQGILVANIFSDKYPNKKEKFQKAFKDISFSRNVAHAHYKSDSLFGTQLGEDLYNYIKNKI